VPELPEVETFRSYLESTSMHQVIEKVVVPSPEILGNCSVPELRSRLQGMEFESTYRHGKYLMVQTDAGQWLVLHFGMTGCLRYFRGMDEPLSHVRFLVDFVNGSRLAFGCLRKLCRVSLADWKEDFISAKGLGPDALHPEFDLEVFLTVFGGRKTAAKSALMNQKLVAGIGNLYSDEILFQSGVHPETRVAPHSYLIPHRREGGSCPGCDGELKRTKVLGRTTYYCPRCQGDRPDS
jgi:formamidopyrimidine-DNA glycosylase